MREWTERPRGQACPTCGCLVGYGPQMEQDKATHETWHRRSDARAVVPLDLRTRPDEVVG